MKQLRIKTIAALVNKTSAFKSSWELNILYVIEKMWWQSLTHAYLLMIVNVETAGSWS